MEKLLRELVQELSEYNEPDMLDGYLDGLGDKYNDRLKELGLPTIEQSGYEE